MGDRVPGPHLSLITELLLGFCMGAAFVAFIILIAGVSGTYISKQHRTVPNQGIHNSGWNALRVGCASMVLFGLLALLAWLSAGSSGGWESGLIIGPIAGMLPGLFFGLRSGGTAYLRHYILRFLLWRAGLIPQHYVRFLEEATERILLQRVGGGYRFIHPLFQDYFASLGTAAPPPPVAPPPSHHP